MPDDVMSERSEEMVMVISMVMIWIRPSLVIVSRSKFRWCMKLKTLAAF